MFKGSLYGQWEAIVTFTVMIVLADQHGEVDMTPEALAASTSIPLDIILKGIADLERPDPKSRTPDEEGRRIVRVSDTRDWGWIITNYDHYRKMRSAEERREYMRAYQRERRAAEKAASTPPSTPVNNVTHAVSSKQEAVSRKKEEAEEEAPSAATLADRFEDEAHRSAYLAYYRAHRFPDGLDAGLVAVHEGRVGPAQPWEKVGAALVAMRAAQVDFSQRAVAGFARKVGVALNGDVEAQRADARATLDAEIAAGRRGEMF